MTDRRVRELERRWRESGLVEDEAQYLLALVRVGAFDPAKLALAAALGNPAADRALELADSHDVLLKVPAPIQVSRSRRQRWQITWTSSYTHTLRLLQAARSAHPRAVVAARCGIVAGCLDVLSAARPGQRRPRQFLEATRRWLQCPCTKHLRKARAAREKLHKLTTRPRRGFRHESVADAAVQIWSPEPDPEPLPFEPLGAAFEATGASWDDACQHAQSWLYDWSRLPTE